MVWAIAAVLSAMAVILRTPILGFSSFTSVSGGGFSLLLRTLAAAVIGGMESLPITAVAAVGPAVGCGTGSSRRSSIRRSPPTRTSSRT